MRGITPDLIKVRQKCDILLKYSYCENNITEKDMQKEVEFSLVYFQFKFKQRELSARGKIFEG